MKVSAEQLYFINLAEMNENRLQSDNNSSFSNGSFFYIASYYSNCCYLIKGKK